MQKIIAYKCRWRIKYSQPHVIKSGALSKVTRLVSKYFNQTSKNITLQHFNILDTSIPVDLESNLNQQVHVIRGKYCLW
jgi:hypothetical protein